jgi:hypothetical protein
MYVTYIITSHRVQCLFCSEISCSEHIIVFLSPSSIAAFKVLVII